MREVSSDSKIGVEVSVRLEHDGWVFRVGDKQVKIFNDPLSEDGDRELADLLNVSIGEAWRIKSLAFQNYWPRDLKELRAMFPSIVGEDLNIQLFLLALFSTKLRDPQNRLWGVIIESNNSSGKSHLVKEILEPLRDLEDDQLILEFTRVSNAYIERKFQNISIDRKILYIQEIENAPSQLHLLLSEGKLILAITEKEDGKFKPIEYEANGTPFLVVTTPNWRGNQNLIHRCVMFSLDETAEQTYRIVRHQTILASDFVYRERFKAFKVGCGKVFREIWRKTPMDVEVIIPFLPLIEEKLKIQDPDTKLRRDYPKFLSLIMASALLFYPFRKILKQCVFGRKKTIIIANFQDLLNVLPLVENSFQQILTNLSEKERLVLEKMKEQDFWTYSELTKVTKISSSLLRHKIIPNLEMKGFVIVDREGKSHRIELAKNPESLNIDVSNMHEKALNMINEAVAMLLLSGCQIAKSEISPIQVSIQENKLGNLAFQQNAKYPSVLDKNNQESSSLTIWHTGTKIKEEDEDSYYLSVMGGGYPT
jgi:DNA-binding transcriptional ArsR family regulator